MKWNGGGLQSMGHGRGRKSTLAHTVYIQSNLAQEPTGPANPIKKTRKGGIQAALKVSFD